MMRFAISSSEAILTLRTPIPPEILALPEKEQAEFCRYLEQQLRIALNAELLREARDRALQEMYGDGQRMNANKYRDENGQVGEPSRPHS